MNKKITLLLLLALPITILSCKKCYECEEYDYCLQCTYTYNDGDDALDACYGTEHARDSAVVALQETYAALGGSINCTKTQQKTVGGLIDEICGGKKLAQEKKDDKEFDGFICKEK